MRTNKYTYGVNEEELITAIGEYKYFATAKIFEMKTEVNHNLKRELGKTREEARNKMRRIAEQWIQVHEK